jgi:hypothetical protein
MGGRGLTSGPPQQSRAVAFEYISNSNEFKLLQNLSNFNQSPNSLPYPKNFEIKYNFEALKKMSNFL